MDHADALDCSPRAFERLTDHLEGGTFEGHDYRRLPAERAGVDRGTVLFDDAIVRGYPSTPRALVADPAVRERFDGRVFVEEKYNGYNVRLARVEGDLLAFTRSGHVCPLTTDHARRIYDLDGFFDDHPEAMICAEYVGPETPYTDHDYPGVESMAACAFSVRERASGDPWPVEERRDALDDHDLPQVRLLGSYDDPGTAARAVPDHVRRLDAAGREGVVCKSADGERLLKYTAGGSNRRGLEHAFARPFECGRDFVFARVAREAFQAYETDEGAPALRERAHELGESILLPFVEAIESVDEGRTIGERHTVRGRPAPVGDLLSFLRDRGIELEIERDEEDGGERVVDFRKVAVSSRDKIEYYLGGGTYQE